MKARQEEDEEIMTCSRCLVDRGPIDHDGWLPVVGDADKEYVLAVGLLRSASPSSLGTLDSSSRGHFWCAKPSQRLTSRNRKPHTSDESLKKIEFIPTHEI